MRCGCADLGDLRAGSSITSASSCSGRAEKTFCQRGAVKQRGRKKMVQNVILVFFRRRLSQRPAVEELESRNILKRKKSNRLLYAYKIIMQDTPDNKSSMLFFVFISFLWYLLQDICSESCFMLFMLRFFTFLTENLIIHI